jgi:hypothetical protein
VQSAPSPIAVTLPDSHASDRILMRATVCPHIGVSVRFDKRAELQSAARHRLSMTRAEEVLMLPLRAETTAL